MTTGTHATAAPADGLAIDLRGVAKTYKGKVHALRGIDLSVGRGEVFGLLGPNGAGKSTLVKILMTVIRPSACSGSMLNQPVGHKATLARVGYLPEHHKFPGYLTAQQVVDHYAAMGGVDRSTRRQRTPELLDLVGLTDWSRKRVRQFSKGMRQRLGIAQALANEPDIVLLDEPTDGVDPIGRRDIRDIVRRLKDDGKTVFLNSHLLSELEMVCDRVAILVKGVVASQGSIDELTSDQRCYEIELDGTDRDQLAQDARAALPGVREAGADDTDATPTKTTGFRGALANGEWVEIDRGLIRVGIDDPAAVQPVLDALRAKGLTIRSLRPHRPSLEDLFVAAVTDPRTGETLSPGADNPGKRRAAQ